MSDKKTVAVDRFVTLREHARAAYERDPKGVLKLTREQLAEVNATTGGSRDAMAEHFRGLYAAEWPGNRKARLVPAGGLLYILERIVGGA